MGNPVNKQENVPQIMIKKAAGLFMAEIGAPLRIMPTKTETIPIAKPTTVDVSKISPPLFPDNPAARKHPFLRCPPCTRGSAYAAYIISQCERRIKRPIKSSAPSKGILTFVNQCSCLLFHKIGKIPTLFLRKFLKNSPVKSKGEIL